MSNCKNSALETISDNLASDKSSLQESVLNDAITTVSSKIKQIDKRLYFPDTKSFYQMAGLLGTTDGLDCDNLPGVNNFPSLRKLNKKLIKDRVAKLH